MASATPPTMLRHWPFAVRAGFRFAFVWFLLTNMPFPIGDLPWLAGAGSYYREAWGVPVGWAAVHVVHIHGPLSAASSNSGDRTFDWLLAATFMVVAALSAVAWSIADRRRLQYEALHDGLRVYLRFSLAAVLIGFGLVKVFPAQFLFPGNDALLERYGSSSPMHLLWTFMGYSRTYTVFGGMAEIAPAVLLFFRRTTTLGALLAIAVLTNVIMLNLSYDVPVKLYSMELLAIALFLAIPDLRRLASFFVLQRPTQPAAVRPPPRARWMRVASRAVPLALAVLACADGVRTLKVFSSGPARPRLYGIYEVDTFEVGGRALPPLASDPVRWRRVIVNRWGTVIIQHMNDTQEWFQLEDDSSRHVAKLTANAETGVSYELSYEHGAGDAFSLEGAWRGAPVRVATHRVDDTAFLLVNREFRWVSEQPFNR